MSSSSPTTSQNTPTPTKDAKISSPTVYRRFNDKLKSGLVPKSADIEVKLLRHLVDAFGMATTQERVAAFKRITFPSTLQALEQYIGMTGWLRAYLPSYAHAVDLMQERKTQLLEARRKIERCGRKTERLLRKDNIWTHAPGARSVWKIAEHAYSSEIPSPFFAR